MEIVQISIFQTRNQFSKKCFRQFPMYQNHIELVVFKLLNLVK